MKRTTVILVLVLVLSLGGYFFWANSGKAPDNIFHIKPDAQVTGIEMEKIVKGERVALVKLDKKGDDWILDNQYTAISGKVDNLLKTLTQIRVVAPIPDEGQESALQLVKKNHTRVEVFDENGSFHEYLIGPTDNTHSANIMLVDGASKAHLVSKPGFQGYVSVFYSTNPIEWRERVLFNLTPQNLKQVKIAYPTNVEEQGFELRQDADGEPWMLEEGLIADVTQTDGYLGLFTGKISAESFANEAFPEMRDSLERRTPDVTFAFTTKQNDSGKLHLFTRSENLNNYFGYLEGKPELYTIQRFVMDKFFKTKAWKG